jgi:hypothetical protein
LCFHTSGSPSILGKYSLRHLAVVIALAAATPAVYLGIKWLLTSHVVMMRSGDRLDITPALKLKALLAVVAFAVITSETAIYVISDDLERNLAGFDPYLQLVPARSDPALHVNRWGFRGEEIDMEKPPGTFRIFYLGGSTVFCARAEWEKSHPRILEKLLRERYPDMRIEVQNAAMEWHSTEHSLIKLQTKVEDFNPDLVILYHAMNDMYRSLDHPRYALGTYRPDYSHFYGPLEGMLNAYRSSRVPLKLFSVAGAYRNLERHILRKWFSDIRQAGKQGRVEMNQWVSLHSFERNLRNIAEYLSRKGVGVVFASQPYLYKVELSPEEEAQMEIPARLMVVDGWRISMRSIVKGMEDFNDTTRRVAQDYGAEFLDLAALVPKKTANFYDGIHYSEKGNSIIGSSMAEFVIRRRLLERAGVSATDGATEGPD